MADTDDGAQNQPVGYVPPKVWIWDSENGGPFANINRPVSGATHDKMLPVGEHPFQLYSMNAQRRENHNHARRIAGSSAFGRRL
jgi:GSH-dependent disulfide-bond oxidoreductase